MLLQNSRHYNMPKEKPPNVPSTENGYSVGRYDDLTVLKLTAGANSMTLSLDDVEVYRLIRLLEASLDEQPE